MDKPNAVVLGGTGFIGRTLVKYLFDEKLCGRVRVVDKVLPVLSWLTEHEKKAFDSFEFLQADLLKAGIFRSLILRFRHSCT